MLESHATEVPLRHRDCSVDRERTMEEPYRDRRHAGAELARRLGHLKRRSDLVVLALPRGGVPVAYEVARSLEAPVDVFVVRKLGLPGHPEYAMGALASGGVRVLNDDAVRLYGIPNAVIDQIAREEQIELERRERAYRAGRPPFDLRGRVVVLIDDGLATGSTMRAAVQAVRARAPATVIVAVPVGSPDTCREFAAIADEIVCARSPDHFAAVGQWYDDFRQTTDEEVRALLHDASFPVAGKER
jgi:predicted phosphoribosyltransferase